MKSQQVDNKSKTSCKECVLAVYEGKTQTKCAAGRIEKLEHFEAYDDEKEFFVVERFCNFYRNNNDEYIKDDGTIDIEKIKEECRVTFDVIVLCNNIDDEYAKYILDLYKDLDAEYTGKFSFQLLYTIATKEQSKIIKNISEQIGCSTTFYSDELYLHTFLSKTSKSYHVIVSKESRIEKDFIINLNHLVTNELKKIIAYSHKSILAISNLAYKITSFKHESTKYTDIITNIVDETKKTDLYHEQE